MNAKGEMVRFSVQNGEVTKFLLVQCLFFSTLVLQVHLVEMVPGLRGL